MGRGRGRREHHDAAGGGTAAMASTRQPSAPLTYDHTAPGGAGGGPNMCAEAPLDLKALRMAVHGWWLGNPLVYKPGVPDLLAVARELAGAGATSGTLLVSDAPTTNDPAPAAARPTQVVPRNCVEAVLILRPPPLWMSIAPEMAATRAIAEVAQAVLGVDSRSHAAPWPPPPAKSLDPAGDQLVERLCRVTVEEEADVVFLDLRLALGELLAVRRDGDEHLPAGWGFFARRDWREVFLARVLHTLEVYVTALR